jgi:tRNA (guanine10-N2)-methyltransferase
MARIQNHDYVLDPFVGTGSLLIPPSHFGAVTTGCDIDMRVLKGYSVGYTKPTMKKVSEEEEHTNIYTNFLHYDLPCPQILRSDINHPCFKNRGFFDSIICDPPYGYRAISRKTGMKEEKKEKRQKRLTEKYGNLLKINQDNLDKRDEKDSNDETTNKNIEEPIDINTCKERHRVFTYNGKNETFIFSPLKQCSVESIFENLLNLGDSCLKEGGLLVCLYPTEKPKEQDPM